jgi:predicted glycogen debranching enzyme
MAGGGVAMSEVVLRQVSWLDVQDDELALTEEWLVTNGLGGFASGTLSGIATRRYHGLLVAALPAPLGRTVMLSHLQETLVFADGEIVNLSEREVSGTQPEFSALRYLKSFQLEMGLPVWHYEINGLVLEKRLFMPYQQNTVHVCYRVISATEPVRLELRPALHYRALEAAVDENPVAETDYVLSVREDYFKLTGGNFPPLYLKTHGGEATFTIDRRRSEDIFYRLESFRGYAAVGQYWTPGAFAMTLGTTGELTFTCSTEKPETLRLVAPEEAYELEVKRRFQL